MRKIFIVILAAALLLPMVVVVTPASAATSVSIYEIQYTTDLYGDSNYNEQTVTTQGVVTRVFYNGYFIQDPDGGPWTGLWVYDSNEPAVGDQLQLTGEVDEYYGLTELKDVTAYTVMSTGNTLPAAEVLPTGDVSQEQWEGVLVRVENVTVTDDDLGFGEWEVDDDSGPAVVDNLGDYGYSPTDGDLLEFVQGPVNYSYSAFKIAPRDDDDIAVYVPPPPVVTIMEIQGSEQYSPYDGQLVETSGLVTLFTANGANFWLQDPTGDGDTATSDGIFVSGGGYPGVGPRPEVGDFIRIIAKV